MNKMGTILCIDVEGLSCKLTVGKTYSYTTKELFILPSKGKFYQYHLIDDQGYYGVFGEHRFQNISDLREEKLDLLLNG